MTKNLRDTARSKMMGKLQRLGAQGSMREAKAGEDAPRKYAIGGGVTGAPVSGSPTKPRLDRPGRGLMGRAKPSAKGKKTGKSGGKTNVNVIIMGKGDAGPPKPEMPMMPPPGGPPMGPPGGPMAGGPPVPPPGPPPMPPRPMRKFGGKVAAKGTDIAKDKKLAKPFTKFAKFTKGKC